ncbi:MAG: hypothetical protein LBQ90_04395 [Synergistaceae bacterium]|jgi:CRISPR-associated protein (TIGR03984 family)|nr:hypothetical protein [Synergistaceae bacterium]
METVYLKTKRPEKITAQSALDCFDFKDDGSAIVLLYTPSCCRFGSLSEIVTVPNVFEWRCFSQTREVRWVRCGSSNEGIASLLEEVTSCDEGKQYESLQGQYLLWGKKGRGENVLFEHRMGELKVPCEIQDGQRVYLEFREYFSEDDYGNLTFFAERLTGLKALSATEMPDD